MLYNFTIRLRNVLIALVATSCTIQVSMAQSQMQAKTYESRPTYNTTNPELAVDDLMTTSATLSPWLVGGAALRVDFPAAVAVGQQATMLVRAGSGGLLTASLLGKMTVHMFLSSSSKPNQDVQTVQLSDQAVKVALLAGSSDINQITFPITQMADQLQLQSDALVTITPGLTDNTNGAVNVYAVFATVAPLPVQLATFQGKATAAGVALTWTTASEQQNDHFVVERASSPSADFEALSQVRGAGSSTQVHQYQFVDAAPGSLGYYRLRMVATDGTASFSSVVVVQATGASLAAYPNPAMEALTVTGPAGTHLSIFNQMGQQVQVADISTVQTQRLDVSSLPGGVYILRDAATGQSTRFVKSSR